MCNSGTVFCGTNGVSRQPKVVKFSADSNARITVVRTKRKSILVANYKIFLH